LTALPEIWNLLSAQRTASTAVGNSQLADGAVSTLLPSWNRLLQDIGRQTGSQP
jgi:hypothetical protein